MADPKSTAHTTPSIADEGRGAPRKVEVRNRILDAWIALMVEGAELNHDAAAARTGLGRRTVYRYFPDRAAMMDAALTRVRELAGPQVVMPASMDDLLATLEPIYTGFDRIAAITTVIRSTPQGRALRLAQKDQRVRAYTAAAAEPVRALPPRDQVIATAIFQMLHTTPWLELRDHWGLSGEEIARGTGWAIRALLADLARRGAEGLDKDVAEIEPDGANSPVAAIP